MITIEDGNGDFRINFWTDDVQFFTLVFNQVTS